MRILALIFLLIGCNDFSNSLDEKRFDCGEGYDPKKEYIKIEGDQSLQTFPNSVPITSGGCIERPRNDEIYITDSERKSGVWINSQSRGEVVLKPMNPSQLPLACNSVVHGDGRGFSLSFDSVETIQSRNLQSIEISLSSLGGELITAWSSLKLSKTLVYNFDENRPVLAGEYRLMARISDAISGAESRSECILRVDHSQLLISPAESVKTKRSYQGQEILIVQPGYNVNFYVHEGFRDVSIEYCLKRVSASDIKSNIDSNLLKCETTIDFLKAKSPSIDQGFWILNFRGQRGLVRNAWQHSIFLVEKTCAGTFTSPNELEGKDCTTIRGSLEIGDNFDWNSVRALDSISVVYGNVDFAILPRSDPPDRITIMPNLQEVFGSVTATGYFNQGDVFGALQSVWGDFEYSFSAWPGITSFKSLTSVSGRVHVSGSGGEGWGGLVGASPKRTYPVIFPSLKLVEGEVSVEYLSNDTISFFPALEVCHTLVLQRMEELREINGFKNLRSVNTVNLSSMAKLSSLGDVNNFKKIDRLVLSSLNNIKDLSKLNIAELDDIEIFELSNLESILGKDRKLTIRKNFKLSGQNKLKDLSDFQFAEKIDNFALSHDSIPSLKGAEVLREIGTFSLNELPRLYDFGPLEGLTRIESQEIYNMDNRDFGKIELLLVDKE